MKMRSRILQAALVVCFVSVIIAPGISLGQLPANARIFVTISGKSFEGAIYKDNLQAPIPKGTGTSSLQPEFKTISVTKALDNWSPVLRKWAVNGNILQQIIIDFKEEGVSCPSFNVTLKGAVITEVSLQAVGSGTNETIVFGLADNICWTYFESSGGTCTPNKACWDLKKNIAN